ncbi:hypothetical protein ASPZODRAFT_19585 [Penicilliopsis zonata CBS 506.65]|uniref:FAD-binding domain-containing protein n=1 Tax=Penicilliopsis zonata CBS 506.65 TaxID=1073090 RepID=A0A1L9S7P9_9EURO|nr:hypothetical protein ASPZODRAFT_19585 [Penicilliopsis zonata CBS 506.65]OJJ43181.1 hypothetical protein ASPZODRAFT_19585 [Penicilliopsis zonata CBS 506.65]
MPLSILISGAGIAGTALAFRLSKLGHRATVVERFPHLHASGLQLDLRGDGIQILRQMDLEDVFRAHAVPEQGIQLVDSAGRQRAYFPARNHRSGPVSQAFTSEWGIMRGDLCRIVYQAAQDRVTYRYGTSIESFEQDSDEVVVHLSDGTTGSFHLLVGADGQASQTREMMLRGTGHAEPFHSLDGYTAYFTIPWTPFTIGSSR